MSILGQRYAAVRAHIGQDINEEHIEGVREGFDANKDQASGLYVIRDWGRSINPALLAGVERMIDLGIPGELPWQFRRQVDPQEWKPESIHGGLLEKIVVPVDLGPLYSQTATGQSSASIEDFSGIISVGLWFQYLYNTAMHPEQIRIFNVASYKGGRGANRHPDSEAALAVSLSLPTPSASAEIFAKLGTIAYLPSKAAYTGETIALGEECDGEAGEVCVQTAAYDAVLINGPENVHGNLKAVEHSSSKHKDLRYNIVYFYKKALDIPTCFR